MKCVQTATSRARVKKSARGGLPTRSPVRRDPPKSGPKTKLFFILTSTTVTIKFFIYLIFFFSNFIEARCLHPGLRGRSESRLRWWFGSTPSSASAPLKSTWYIPLSADEGEYIGRHLRDAAQSRRPRDGDACFRGLGGRVDEVEIAGLHVRREDEPRLRGR